MKKILKSAAVLAAGILLCAGTAPHKTIKQTRTLDGFIAVAANTGITVKFTQAPLYSVEVEAEERWIPHIVTEVRDGVLNIYMETRDTKKYKDVEATVYVSAPALKAVTASSASVFLTKGTVESDDLRLKAGSGGRIEGAFNCEALTATANSGGNVTSEIRCTEATLEATSGSYIELTGKAETLAVRTGSGAAVRTEDLLCETASVQSSSGSSAKVYASKSLKGSASSGASIRYAGNPSIVEVSTGSGGSVRPIR